MIFGKISIPAIILIQYNLVNVFGRSLDYDGQTEEATDYFTGEKDYGSPTSPDTKGGSCILDLNRDLPKRNEPLLLSSNRKFILPETEGTRGIIALRQGEEILIACPGGRNGLATTSEPVSRAVCNSGTSLMVNGQDMRSQDLDCRSRVQAATRITQRSCANGKGTIVELGFQTDGWVKLMEVCHNIPGSETYYAHHTINGAVISGKVIRPKGTRPPFARGDRQLFAGFDPDAAYKQANQEQVLTRLLGAKRADELLGGKASNAFLSRGHLAPDADFLFSPHQYLTYFYVNVGPQWQVINAGNWLRVEENTRQIASRLADDMEVVTGTYGVLKLENDKGVLREIRLQDQRLPVPELFWKLVRSSRDDSCIAFVASNNPFATSPPSNRLCRDVCAANGWPVLQNDLRRGFIYCCEYAELKRAVPELPDVSCKKTLRFR